MIAPTIAPTSLENLEFHLRAQPHPGWDEWWHCAANVAFRAGHWQPIGTRVPGGLYLARFWLSTPRVLSAAIKPGGLRKFDSGNSVLLHYFARGDDDQALHDHPWAHFTTEVLAGGYDEHLPPWQWEDAATRVGLDAARQMPGPAWDARIEPRFPGDGRRTIVHGSLHCVGAVLPGTWSLVVTGPRVVDDPAVDWGFHPPGREWIGWQAYLAEKQAAQA